jgi:serine phosphatase RsbU (regulator of sigma subunit)
MERRSGKRSSSAGSEKMERVGDRWEKMERYCSTGQSPQRAVAPKEEEEEEEEEFSIFYLYWSRR